MPELLEFYKSRVADSSWVVHSVVHGYLKYKGRSYNFALARRERTHAGLARPGRTRRERRAPGRAVQNSMPLRQHEERVQAVRPEFDTR
jgi:hypothetical protein